jgi:hypothetical protein
MPKVPSAELANERLSFITDAFGAQQFVQLLLDDAWLSLIRAYRVDKFNAAQMLAADHLWNHFAHSVVEAKAK